MVARAKINPAMMAWAREYAGFTDGYEENLPKEIKSRYESWENGDTQPTWKQLRKVSRKYRIPTAFFFRSTPPEIQFLPDLLNYRKTDDSLYEKETPNLIANIRKSEVRRSIYIDLLKAMNNPIIPFKEVSLKQNKAVFSNYIRDVLDVDLDTQKNWINTSNSKDYNHYRFLRKWKEVINEKFGILIFETKDVELSEMRGLCIFFEEIPIILLNGKDSVNGRIFTLFHELTHLLLGDSAICNINLEKKEEIFCNSVAGEFLVPSDDFKKVIKNFRNVLSKDSLNKLSHVYGVSKYVILRRLLDVNEISLTDYNLKVEEFEMNSLPIKPTKGDGGSHFNNQVKYNGIPYYSTVFTAYDLGIIGTVEFTKYTNLSQKYIPMLQERLMGGE